MLRKFKICIERGLFILLTLSCFPLQSQNTFLEGVLLDQESQTPIPYAHIAPLVQSNGGGLSNVDGVFRINWSQDFDSVLIRHLNYGQVKIEVASLEDTVWLTPVPIVLDEVPIFSESPEDLWKRVIEHVDENHFHEKVAYEADVRCMIYSHDRDTLHYVSQSRANLYYDEKKEKWWPRADQVSTSRKALSELGREIAGSESMIMFEIPPSSFMEADAPFFKRSSNWRFDITVERSFVQEGMHLAEVHLIPKWSERRLDNVFIIDLETYGIMRARMEWLVNGRKDLSWYEVAFEGIGGKYYKTYTDTGFSGPTGQPYFQQMVSSLTVLERSPSEEAARYFQLFRTPVQEYQIPWNDPYWQSRPSVPWPDWVAERLKAEGLAR